MVNALFIIGIIPSLLWLIFFLDEDLNRPEPYWMILLVFIGGAFSAIFAAFPEFILKNAFNTGGNGGPTWFLFAAALIEEVSKFIFVYLIIRRSKYFDEKVDGMIYMITAALGFAALENMLNLFGTTSFSFDVLITRGIGATLLHALSSALLGFYWMRGHLWKGISAATILHGIFNYLVLILSGIEIYASLLLLFAAIIVLHDFEILKTIDFKLLRKLRKRSSTHQES